ncbi:MAG TPA: MBOAT family O-acyltransferase [Bacteroidia bacterium]|nr:MBOAT family O-acyltransferase [Bacteroidia bacterium]
MLFNSIQFFLFFPIVTIIYFLLPHKFRWVHLLIASCIFYMAFIPVYILILFFTIIIDYIAGIYIEKSEGKLRKRFLIMSIIANVGVLAVFKYYNFFIDNFNGFLHILNLSEGNLPLLKIILPIGLSFHTFQAMSYTIEVYRGEQKAERHLGIYALYVMFYPQLLAGPIERPQNMIHQFYEKKSFNYHRLVSGLKLMAWGLFKKCVIADRLSVFVDPVFGHPHDYKPVVILIAAIFYSFQMLCDFSGYTDIAIGAARIMGFTLMKNFDRPYSSKSISEYWTRWHISLTSWFRDYVFYPLSISLSKNKGNGAIKLYVNLFIVFLLSGLWHGASWTFVAWGALHGIYLIFAIISRNIRGTLNGALGISRNKWIFDRFQVITTFSLVTIALVIFRSPTIKNAFYIWGQMFQALIDLVQRVLVHGGGMLGQNCPYPMLLIVLSFGLILFLESIHFIQSKTSISTLVGKQPLVIRWGIYYALIIAIVFGGVYGNTQFIYFQF